MKNKALTRAIIIGVIVLAMICFLTNPNQTDHLKAIHEAVEMRFPKPSPGLSYQPIDTNQWSAVIQYHNYGIFSTATIFDVDLSTGFLGRVQTTNEVTLVVTGPPKPR